MYDKSDIMVGFHLLILIFFFLLNQYLANFIKFKHDSIFFKYQIKIKW